MGNINEQNGRCEYIRANPQRDTHQGNYIMHQFCWKEMSRRRHSRDKAGMAAAGSICPCLPQQMAALTQVLSCKFVCDGMILRQYKHMCGLHTEASKPHRPTQSQNCIPHSLHTSNRTEMCHDGNHHYHCQLPQHAVSWSQRQPRLTGIKTHVCWNVCWAEFVWTRW